MRIGNEDAGGSTVFSDTAMSKKSLSSESFVKSNSYYSVLLKANLNGLNTFFLKMRFLFV